MEGWYRTIPIMHVERPRLMLSNLRLSQRMPHLMRREKGGKVVPSNPISSKVALNDIGQ